MIHPQYRHLRRGNIVALTAISTTMLLGFTALAVDVGIMYNARTELQRTADAAALAGVTQLLSDSRLKGSADTIAEMEAVQLEISAMSAINAVLGSGPEVSSNPMNVETGDVLVGYLSEPENLDQALDYSDPNLFNTVHVMVRRDGMANGPIPTWFAQLFGIDSIDVSASASATVQDGIVGFEITDMSGNAGILPFALHIDAWEGLLAETWTTGDNFDYDSVTKTVLAGPDDINELNIYPGAGPTQLPPGNFGTVDIGSDDNSTADIARQILFGINQEDMSYLGGELSLGEDGTLILDGDTGLSVGIKEELEAIIGRPSIIPLFDHVEGTGDTAAFTVVGFVGIRIVDVLLTTAPGNKRLVVQPAFVIDSTAKTGDGTEEGTTSWLVYGPPQLTR